MLNVPLTGPMIAGPMGLVNLPRMWQKGLLARAGVLADDYAYATRGFDRWMIEGIGIDGDALVAFIRTLPSYPETETWVRSKATRLENLEATNERIVTRRISSRIDESARRLVQQMQERAGVDASFLNGPQLNNLDDFSTLRDHLDEVRSAGRRETVVPAISSFATGPLGGFHLARLWGRATVAAVDALPMNYPVADETLDRDCSANLGFDLDQALAFCATLPKYTAFEGWLRHHAARLDGNTVRDWNERMLLRRPRVLESDVGDWHLLHRQVLDYCSSSSRSK